MVQTGFSNRVALITGGATGIGLELARQLRLRNNEVVICGRRQELVESALRSIPGLRGIACDLGADEGIDRLLDFVRSEKLTIDLLVNNAGIQVQTDLMVADDRITGALEYELQVNLLAPMKLTKRLLPSLLSRPDAVILNMLSLLAIMPKANAPGYCAAKAGLFAFSKSLRVLLAQRDIRVFVAFPPLVDTPMTRGRGSNKMPVDTFVRGMLEQMSRGRLDICVGSARTLYRLERLSPALAGWWTRRISAGSTLPAEQPKTPPIQ